MYEIRRNAQEIAQIIIYIYIYIFCQVFPRNSSKTPKIRAKQGKHIQKQSVSLRKCRKSARFSLFSCEYRVIQSILNGKRCGFAEIRAVFPCFHPFTPVFCAASAVFARVSRDCSAVGKIPGKSKARAFRFRFPKTTPPASLGRGLGGGVVSRSALAPTGRKCCVFPWYRGGNGAGRVKKIFDV